MTDEDPALETRAKIDWRNRDHTRGSLAISLLVLALPSLATSLAGVAFQITELTFISRLGEAPMASVVIVNQTLRQTFFMLLMGASFGTQALIAGSVGSGNIERAEHIAGQAISLGFSVSAVLMFFGGLFPEFLFSLPGPEPAFYEYGVPYLRLVFLLNFGVVGTLFFGSIMSGAGDTTMPLFVMLFQTAIALVAEWVLIFGNLGAPELGVRGVAIGVAIGQISAMLLGLAVLFSGRARVHLRRRHMLPDTRVMKQIIRLSWPPALQMVGGVVTTFAFLRIAGDFGESVQAAYAIGLRLGMIAPMVCFPLAGACATIVGQALGAGDVNRAWRAMGTGLVVHATIMFCFSAAFMFFRVEILEFFSSDPEVIRIGSEYLWWLSLSVLLWAFYFVFMRSLQGAGDFVVPMALSLGTSFLVTLPLAWYLARHTDLAETGIWIAQLVSSGVLTISTGIWVATGRWTRRAAHSVAE
ncbi:MAG: MATE family efflux transporter [Deltaproteobacteria bacterium]|nr:MATE family efflux transporter [Deltaproteobacteria bacterium]MBW2398921.1 MATE family efflux transporter [Deltaproteobacteria bacterium]MBW2665121.1 MATE family efflux transporter [Deltaproteobacteria bacterium]